MAIEQLDPNGNHREGGDAAAYQVNEEPLGTPRHLRVLCIGAGASGINTARHIEMHMENVGFCSYEKNSDVGGTWLENRYPGCACDIPSHNYQFTWEPNTRWSHFYSGSQEIFQYMKGVVEKYELYKYIKLRHMVTNATWDENEGKWFISGTKLATGETFEDWGHVLINGTGILNNWKWPDIPGLHDFKGHLMHSADWAEDWKPDGRTVALLGCGSSGIQIVPAIQEKVKSLTTFIRTPTWITSGFAQSYAGPGGSNFEFSGERKSKFESDPQDYMRYRKAIEGELNQRFRLSKEQEEAKLYSINEMKTKLGHDERLIKAMIPKFDVGCRRPTPGNGYLEALKKPNVTVVTVGISHIVPEGVALITGEVVKVDTFICATGFDISFCPRFKLIGRNGVNIAGKWKHKPEAYFSVAADDFPNYFMFLGPNAPVGHGSVLPIIEHATKYMINVMKKMQTQGIKSFEPKVECVREFNTHAQEFLKRTAWATNCRSWFKNGRSDGPIVALHPGSRIHWFHMLEDVRYEDYTYTYLNPTNRYQYVGNGFSTNEAPGMDTTTYFDDPQKGYRSY